MHTVKATTDIAAGQELFVRYGTAAWFESKNIPYIDVDYESTMWRPDLQPLPCRESFRLTTGEDGRHTFSVVETIPAGNVLEISLCLEVSVIAVDQFPFLWDYVIMDPKTKTVCARDVEPVSYTHLTLPTTPYV